MFPSHPQTSRFLQHGLFNDLAHFTQLESRIAALASEEDRQAAFAVFAEAFLAIRTLPQATEIWPDGIIPREAQRRYLLPERIPGAHGFFRTFSGELHPYHLIFCVHPSPTPEEMPPADAPPQESTAPPQEERPPASPPQQERHPADAPPQESTAPQKERPPLSREESAPFLALCDRIPHPLLLTNLSHLPPPLQNRTECQTIRGTDLDRMTPHTFRALRRWLQGGGIVPERPPLSPLHAQAVADLQTVMASEDRATGLFAPGTGVERVTLKLAEGVGKGRTVLVFLPSLAHIRDLLFLWRRHAVWSSLACLWIGAETPSDHDAPRMQPSDLDVPLVQESEAIRRFLTWRFPGVRVLFAPYHAARIAARAMIGFAPVDLGLFLESQVTTSDPFALDDANIPIRKRLFFASTARHANALIKQPSDPDKKRDLPTVWSLENPTRYGRILPLAPLEKAVTEGLARPWKCWIVVTPIQAASTSTPAERRDQACVDALLLALAHAMPAQAVGPIHTYHDTAQAARAFTEKYQAVVRAHKERVYAHQEGMDHSDPSVPPPPPLDETLTRLFEYTPLHLAGASVTTDRDQVLARFDHTERAILSSARCLAEGLTPPPADMVLLCASPKKTKQNMAHTLTALLTPPEARPTPAPPPETGKHPETTHSPYGLICIPLFLSAPNNTGASVNPTETSLEAPATSQETPSTTEPETPSATEPETPSATEPEAHKKTTLETSLEASLASSDALWELLQLLRTLDTSLDDQIRQAGETFGRTGSWPTLTHEADGSDLASRMEIVLPDGLPASWNEAIWHALLERLSSPWDQRFGQLHRYDWHEIPGLNAWVEAQRQAYAKGTLARDRQERLEKFGFVWDPKQVAWDAHCAAFERHTLRHTLTSHGKSGDNPPPTPEDPDLAAWIQQQRKDWKKGRLDAPLISRLDRAGFVWDPEATAWEAMFSTLKRFQQTTLGQRHGNTPRPCLIPEQFPENPALATWAKQQRAARAKERLDPDRLQRLNALGFVWDLKEAEWQTFFAAFVQFKQRHGHGKIPETWPENPSLALWAKEQRKAKAKTKLPEKHAARLEAEHFCWDLEAAHWEEMAQAWETFCEKQGHGMVPPGWPENPPLADWVVRQRRDFLAGRLTEARITRLNARAFVWDPEEKAWQEMWHALAAFHAKEGHCHIPEDTGTLARWVHDQRRAGAPRRAGRALKPQRRAQLDTLGFVWDPEEARWEALFVALQNFRTEHNHCIVPAKWPENTPHSADGKSLSRWVTTLRKARAKGTLSDERVQRLTDLGFVWDAKAVFWEEMFVALTEFRDRHGNCLVPETYEENSPLAWWVATQRKAYKSGQLEPERISRLNDLGFFWDPLEAHWYEMFQALLRYREHHGHCLITRDGPKDPKLETWAATQRQARMRGNLSQVRIERLDALGFLWDPKEVILEEMLHALAAFRTQHGHCDIPAQWEENPDVGLWVQFQRQAYKKGTLDPERVRRLEAVGLSWT